MATQTKNSPKKAANKLTSEQLISIYMDYVLEHEERPKSVYKFVKMNKLTEDEFYGFFGSFEGLRQEIWHQFYQKSIDLMHKAPETESFSSREKMLTFFFTFFEMLTANRSYVLFALQEHQDKLKNLEQLKGLRKDIKNFTKELLKEDNDEQQLKLLQKNETIFSEGAWIQTMFLIKFWMDDNSADFEKTDVAIEKSVNTIFDVFDNTPFERVIDFGKFLLKNEWRS